MDIRRIEKRIRQREKEDEEEEEEEAKEKHQRHPSLSTWRLSIRSQEATVLRDFLTSLQVRRGGGEAGGGEGRRGGGKGKGK